MHPGSQAEGEAAPQHCGNINISWAAPSQLVSSRVFNCHETIQNFQLRANRLPSASQPVQAGVIILKASDRTVHLTGSPDCLSAVVAVPLQALSTLSPHTASRHLEGS